LERFIRSFEKLTGLEICVYDLAYFTVHDARLNLPAKRCMHCSSFCLKIKENPDAWERCKQDEYFRASEAWKRNAPFLHTCHAGLTDLVLPIRRGTQQLGAIYLGQCVTVDSSQTRRVLKRLGRTYGFDLVELNRLLGERPRRTARELRGFRALLEGWCDYIELADAMAGTQRHSGEVFLEHSGPIRMEDVPTPYLDQLNPRSAPIGKAVVLVRQGYWKNISQATVARQVGLSPSHFTREFQKQTGFSFRRCLVMARVGAAFYLLKLGSLNLGQIAEMLGYENASSMARAVRSQCGVSPRRMLTLQAPPWLLVNPGPAPPVKQNMTRK
jgi:AraC-like DNA-binding protein